MADDITSIPSARSKFLNPAGEVDRVWYRFLLNLFTLTGAGTTSNTTDDLFLLATDVSSATGAPSTQNQADLPPPFDPSSLQRQIGDLQLGSPPFDPSVLQNQIDGLMLTPPAQPHVQKYNTGRATLVAGTATVTTPLVGASSQIFLTTRVAGGTLGILSVGTVVDATSFVINSTSMLDTSTVNWLIVDPL
jgi:hypothetical protein